MNLDLILETLTDLAEEFVKAVRNILLIPVFIVLLIFLLFVGFIGGSYQKALGDKYAE